MKILILTALPEELDKKLTKHPVAYIGVGLSNAALYTTMAIDTHKPDLIINYGSAGTLSADIKGLTSVAKVCQRDADCSPLRERGYMLGENILYYTSGKDGVRVGSGNNFVTDPDEWTKQHCDLVDMELWSIAKVCTQFGIPWTSMKWVSDSADSDAGVVWEDSLLAGQVEFLDWLSSAKY